MTTTATDESEDLDASLLIESRKASQLARWLVAKNGGEFVAEVVGDHLQPFVELAVERSGCVALLPG